MQTAHKALFYQSNPVKSTTNKIYVIGQDADSCTVYGMPKAVADAGAVDEVVTLKGIADAITKHVGVF